MMHFINLLKFMFRILLLINTKQKRIGAIMLIPL